MKKFRSFLIVLFAMSLALVMAACSGQPAETTPAATEAETVAETAAETAAEAEVTTEAVAETETAAQDSAQALEDGVYLAEFNTDSSMFHVNEAKNGQGVLTVKGGEMTIHISLVSKKILNLFAGLAEDAEKEGAALLEPTIDEVTYSDGLTEEVFGFDVPVPYLDDEFDCALIGEKGTWYDHKVSVSNPVPYVEE